MNALYPNIPMSRCGSILLLPFMLWLWSYSALMGQQGTMHLEELEIENAPPLGTPTCIFEDSQGFMWLGCLSGLYLFDGYSLTHFAHHPNDSLSISDNKITVIIEDKQGDLWVGTQSGLNCFDTKKRLFKRYTDKARFGIGDIIITDLRQDKSGNIWVGTVQGLFCVDATTRKFEKYFPAGDQHVSVFALETIETGVCFSAAFNLYFLDFSVKTIVSIPFSTAVDPVLGTIGTSMKKDAGSNIWIGTKKGLFFVEPLSGKPASLHPDFRDELVAFIAGTDKAAELWIGTQSGLSRLNTQTYQCEKNIPLLISGIKADDEVWWKGWRASSGMLWLISLSRKICKLNTLKQQFHHCPTDLLKNIAGPGEFFEMYEYGPGMLLVPEKKGPTLLHIFTGKMDPFPWRPDYNVTGWKDGVVCFWEEEQEGMLWIGTGGGLFLFDKNRKRFINLEKHWPAFSKLRTVPVRKVYRDRKNRLWVATWNQGIFKFDFNTGTHFQYNNQKEDIAQGTGSSRFILESRSGEMWFGTRNGLLKYLEQKDSFVVYTNIPGDPESMSEKTAFCIDEDVNGNIWCGTYGGGLNMLDIKTGKFKHYTTEDGLLNNNVFSTLSDQNGNLWLLGYDGISRFNRASATFQRFTVDNGLLNKAYDAFLYGKSRYSNLLFFCGKTGIDYFDPDNIQCSTFNPEVVITDFKLFNETVPVTRGDGGTTFELAEDISVTREIRLDYEQNVITLGFVALDYASSKTIQYAYQLTGFDKDWQYVGDKRYATYTNLNPGAYTFRVKATNSDGVWGTNMATLVIRVSTPWWRSWWFRSLVLLSLATIIFAFYRYRVRQIKEKEAIRSNLNQRIAEVKMEALRSQMNPHFIFNCLSSLKSYVEKKDIETASVHISKFARLLRQVLDQSKSDTVTLEDELDMLKRYVELEKMRYKEKLNFRIDIQPDLPLQDIKIPPLLVQPYIENAIWHGLKHKISGNGMLLLLVDAREGECRIIVEDNGIGRAVSQQIKEKSTVAHQSHGLNVTGERIALFNQQYGNNAQIEISDLFDTDGNASGTRVTLTFKTDQI